MKKNINQSIVDKYANDIVSGKELACRENIQACQRYLGDISSGNWDFRPEEAEDIISIIEKYIVLLEGEDKDGESLRGQPFKLQTWQKFIVYNLFGFFNKGTKIRRYERRRLLHRSRQE